jgi:hypothetical protein
MVSKTIYLIPIFLNLELNPFFPFHFFFPIFFASFFVEIEGGGVEDKMERLMRKEGIFQSTILLKVSMVNIGQRTI